MPQDAFTLNYLVKELNQRFKGGKINKIVQPENEKIVFTVYTGKGIEKLYLDVNPASPKIGVYEDKDQAPITAPNFCMLMRKHLQNATIESISLIPFDRIVKIDFVQKGERKGLQKGKNGCIINALSGESSDERKFRQKVR